MAKADTQETRRERAETLGEAEQLVAAADVVHAICLTRGHSWPNVDPRKEMLPVGFVVGPIRSDDLFDVTEYCNRCPEYKHYLTRPEDIFGGGSRRSYTPPKDRPVLARNVSRAAWSARLSSDGHLTGLVMAAAQRATEAADRAVAKAESNGGPVVGGAA